MNNLKELLPIGTIIALKGAKKRLMIFGIKQNLKDKSSKITEYDYIGVPYPEGNIGTEGQFVFNHEDIEAVFFRGFEDIERQEFIFDLSKALKENENNA